MSVVSPMLPSSTGPYEGPDLPFDPQEIITLGGCVYDLSGVAIPTSLTGGLLTHGSTPLIAAPPSAALTGDVTTLAYENVGRWLRLKDAAPFLVKVANRLTNAHVEGALAAAGLHEHPDAVTARHQAPSADGGLTRLLQTRIATLGDEVSAELDRAVQLLQYFSTWPAGFAANGPSGSHTSILGCAMGAAEVVGGTAVVILAAGKEATTAGAATPLAAITGAAGVAYIAGGLSTMSAHCP